MSSLTIDESAAPVALRAGLSALISEFPGRFGGGPAVSFAPLAADVDVSLRVSTDGDAANVEYKRPCDAFRAIGRMLGGALEFAETCRFDMLGVMVDVSRNGVVRPNAARSLLCRYALMGINVVMLYSEDTYEVPGEPWFGYLRGRLSADEIKSLDDFADALGIEMFPCIQTLGHLEQILQWPAYDDRRDSGGVLVAEEGETYALIEKMIDAASGPMRSKRIHVGMDEAHGIGSGNYKKRHGDKRAFDILNDHLDKVREICAARGLSPMIWSDMYFRLGSKDGGYYDDEWDIPADVVESIPKDVQLVYWDYYHLEADFYEKFIERHRKLGSEPLVAGGVWTWNRLWAALPFSIRSTDACMTACKAKGLREVFATMWGDDGMECDIYAALPGVQYFADHGYSDTVDEKALRDNFRGSCGGDFDAWVDAAGVDSVPGVEDTGASHTNIGKALLWQDPLLAVFDPQIEGADLKAHYTELAGTLSAAAEKSDADARLAYPAAIAKVLSLKVNLRGDLAAAYKSGDKDALKAIASGDLAALRAAVDDLWRSHRAMWLSTYKPFGLEVVERRYGGLRTRLESLSMRIDDYVSGNADAIEELDAELLKIYDAEGLDVRVTNYDRVATPSCIK